MLWVCLNLWLTVSISCGFHRDESEKKRGNKEKRMNMQRQFFFLLLCVWVCVYCWRRCRCCCLLLLQKCNVLKCCKQSTDPIHTHSSSACTIIGTTILLIVDLTSQSSRGPLPFNVLCVMCSHYYYHYYILRFDFVFSILHLQLEKQQKSAHTHALTHTHIQHTKKERKEWKWVGEWMEGQEEERGEWVVGIKSMPRRVRVHLT